MAKTSPAENEAGVRNGRLLNATPMKGRRDAG